MARGTGPWLTALLAVLLLGEAIAAHAVLGVLAVSAGVFLVAGGPRMLCTLRRGGPALEAEAALAQRSAACGSASATVPQPGC